MNAPFENTVQLAMPPQMPGKSGALSFIQHARENTLSVFSRNVFDQAINRRRVALQRFVLLNASDYIEHVLVKHPERYDKGRLNRQVLGRALGDGLLTSEGEVWRRRRRLMAPAFQQRNLDPLAEVMSERAANLVTRWGRLAESGEPIDMAREMMALTMDIAARALFSYDLGDDVDDLGAALTTLIESFGRIRIVDLMGLPEWLPRAGDEDVKAALALIDGVIYRIIEGRRNSGPGVRADTLDLLLAARDPDTGKGLDDLALRNELLTLFAAGHETTALALTWTWYLLALHGDADALLHLETRQVLDGKPARAADIEQLHYTRMAFEEAMRLYPPVFTISRVARCDDDIGGEKIHKGTIITLSPWVTHRNPRYWSEVHRFIPERFSPENGANRPRFAYFPFGGGPRVCIGNGFALLEGPIVLATLAQHFSVRLLPDHPVVPQGRITLRPKHGLMVTLHARA